MKKLLLHSFLVASVFSAHAQQEGLSKFGFEELRLNTRLTETPDRYRKDCATGGDQRFLFCWYQTEAGGVPLTVDFAFIDSRLSEIRVHFPSKHFDTIWLALRAKYGEESTRESGKVEWYSNPMQPDFPIPDEVLLLKAAPDQPRTDGTRYLAGVQYGLIEYRSLAVAREGARKSENERTQRVKSLGEKL